jgi:hypothetical protein
MAQNEKNDLKKKLDSTIQHNYDLFNNYTSLVNCFYFSQALDEGKF